MSDTTKEYQWDTDWNVLTSRWLETIDINAVSKVYAPIEAIRRANEIGCLVSASPLDLFAAHRFLLTLLYWKADTAGGVLQVRESLLKGEVPRTVLKCIEAEASCFRLFDGETPFLQDPSLEKAKKQDMKSAGSLFAEFATGTNIAHFHHGSDIDMRLCAKCATIGMLRVVPWSQAGGQGLTPSIHNAPPVMVLAFGGNLAVTLGLNLVPLSGIAGAATWTGHFVPSNKETVIPYLEALTWNPRRLHLLSLNPTDVCWRCGQTNVVVGQIVYSKNDETAKRSDKKLFQWQDPSAFYDPKARGTTKKSSNVAVAIKNDDLHFLAGKKEAPQSIVVVENPGHEGWQVIIPCTNPANNKTFDHRQIGLMNLSQDALHRVSSNDKPDRMPKGFDGWDEPHTAIRPIGAKRFVQAAAIILTYADWAALSSAAYREMHESPEAFDIFSGLFWSLRGKIKGLPSRKVAWLMLKLMATVPSQYRISQYDAAFCPLRSLPKRQLDERRGSSPYPLTFPQGHRLESALRNALDSNMRRRKPEWVDWAGLCSGLEQLID